MAEIQYYVIAWGKLSHLWGGGSVPSDDKLNELGKAGWKYITTRPSSLGDQAIFMRRAPDVP